MKGPPEGFLLSTLLRSFTVQGSWNYRTMIGGGFAYALLPALRKIFRGDPEGLERAVGRHSEHFNAHPYLTGVALGAVARMESDGADSEVTQRFKRAIKGPLGSVGDSLVWAGWLPATLLGALLLAATGAPYWLPPLAFVVTYNLGHLALRSWALKTGLREGQGVAGALRHAALRQKAVRLSRGGTVLLGILVGLGLSSYTLPRQWPVGWLTLAVMAFMLGSRFGSRTLRPASFTFILIVLLLTLLGGVS